MCNSVQLLENLNEYNAKVNIDLINHIQAEQASNEKISTLISHIVNAHQIWLERMKGERMSVKVFEVRPFGDLIAQVQANKENTSQILTTRDLNDSIVYINTQRQKFSNTILEMFLHLFNHSSYHRGQINQLLVQEGKKAMVSDYIVYNRTQLFDV